MVKRRAYSVSYDKSQAAKINKIMLSYPNITQKQLCVSCITNWHRLKYLHDQKLINLQRTKRINVNVAKNT